MTVDVFDMQNQGLVAIHCVVTIFTICSAKGRSK